MTSLLGPSRQNYGIQHERLKDDFRQAVSRYYSVQNKIAEQDKKLVNPGSNQDQSKQAGFLEVEQIATVDEDFIRERENAIHQLEADILNVHEIFRDLASMVNEQGEKIDQIERNYENPNIQPGERVAVALRELEEASRQQKNARLRKMCCFLVIVLLLAVVVLTFILYFINTSA